jgi:CxxC motif-containing protein (DUF1111 family)
MSAETKKRFHRFNRRRLLFILALLPFTFFATTPGGTQAAATDPGVSNGDPRAGGPITGLTPIQLMFFTAGQADFEQTQSVTGSVPNTGGGLGPRFNGEGCGQCHSQPAIGGTSPVPNPQIAAGHDQQATNRIPFFITMDGPVREARFPMTTDLRHPDGSVHNLFTITGRTDAPGCKIAQPDFRAAAEAGNLIFRIPTPVFGGGLIESISDRDIVANMNSDLERKRDLGIFGRTNTSGNDATITRFGWKAQNKSLEMFAGEAYNVEVGVTNELFPNERDETPGCQFNGTPEDLTNFDQQGTALPADIIRFATFMRFLDQPKPASDTDSTSRGRQIFQEVGCVLCHTASFTTGRSSVAALTHIQANVFSDLLLHHMGPGLADNVSQGAAGGDEFRTAPLWGLGKRIFFLHDGRASNLVRAIHEHESEGNIQYRASEANTVVHRFSKLRPQEQQDLLNFLRSL